MKSEKQGHVVVTGASSGIGADLTRIFAREGRDLVLVARSRDRLEAFAAELREKHGVNILVRPADLAVPGGAAEVHQRIGQDGITVDVLVNNAGFGMHGSFAELDAARQLQMLQVNVVALTELTRLFVPDMVRRKSGKILNVASTAAFQPCPSMAVYSATKAYVLSFSEALAEELRGAGVMVTCVCPGATQTGFAETAGVAKSRLFRSTMSSAAVAESAYAALMKGAGLKVTGFSNWLLAGSVRLVSIRAAARLARHFLESA